MSRLFDALQKAMASGEAPGMDALFPAGENGSGPTATATTSPEPASWTEESPGAESAAPEGPAPDRRGYRLVTLRLQAGVPALPFDGSATVAAEQYRVIRTKLLHDERRPQVCLVSSPAPGDGKTITAINIAASLALKNDVSVLLMDCDLRRSGVAAILGIDLEPGLTTVLEGGCAFRDAIVQVKDIPGLHVLPAGNPSANPTELLDSAAWRALCDGIRKEFDYAVLDSSPAGSVADYELTQASVDGVVLVVRPDHTNRALALKAAESIPKEKLLGVVVNCAKRWILHRAPGSYYHYSDYQ
jgi:capsular exopolysaccharide synthesis family protein